MTYDQRWPSGTVALNPILSALLSFPVACFSLTLMTDIAYWSTINLLWLHFSEWLLLAGLVFGVLALVFSIGEYASVRRRPSWISALGSVIVLLLAALNSFIHTADGWTAVVPWGLVVSAMTVLAMIVTRWFWWAGDHHA